MANSALRCKHFIRMVATLPFLLALAFIFFTPATAQRQINITLGASLAPNTTTFNSFWLSPSGAFAFGFYQEGDGYAVGVFLPRTPRKTIVWTANRDYPPVPRNSTLRFTSDGRLVLQSTEAQETFVAIPRETAVSASMLDTGNFVLYNSRRDVIWQTFDLPTDTLLAGQHLSPSQQLCSSASESDQSTGLFRLKMQKDGNLVQYPVATPETGEHAYWASGTAGVGDNVTLYLDNDGSLYLLNATGTYVNNITASRGPPKEGIVYLLRIDPDGILRLYLYNATQNVDLSKIWSLSDNKCMPKGLCGLNGFCAMNDQNLECKCLPGFGYVNPGNWTSGCERNFTADSCMRADAAPRYTIQPVSNTVWQDTAYADLTFSTNEECQKACLQDCNCEAVIYNAQSCKKMRLPLKYGRRDLNNANILSIKVGETGSNGNGANGFMPEGKKRPSRRAILFAIASSTAFALITLAVSGFVVYRYRVRLYEILPKEGSATMIENISPRSFTYEELKRVTKDFAEEIGRGAFGTVYKGTLLNSLEVVAVKKLEKVSSDVESEFQNEVKIIGRTHHRSLVQLLGYCLDGHDRLLVYKYMSNGSLADLLFTPEKQPCWDEKMGIARNIARGLLYLHEECETQIIHCDIKPQNILIDKCRRAKISDFGLSKLMKPDQTNTMTRIRGTRGYVAPEWHKNLPVTVKADVYSFGIVLLEIICCRRSVDWSLPDDEAVLEEWAYSCFQERELEKLVNDESTDRRQLERMVKVALWCILEEPSLRPSMRKVLLMLEGTVDIPIPPCPSSFLSAI
ncbi:LOW QUALITY PROTEIN: G-type lectin S-receptor-like serine/threonine-protein kinase LECRK1 [Eucalyptus grandis]|uniref:LOW QUALITY PROTEIN: G-type lectin S-receptor-like serine/threonine-protein kinase LECRK1 n=1 Tax=Eucalyptus grandis TaxID=71139 RepID=UPI00192EBEDF|nr:LOW QUALITY PROTEIN: G-type lectin S-receptor-like serine/threonine-protein kinase LECRK1 [Eucalyptus grandis]